MMICKDFLTFIETIRGVIMNCFYLKNCPMAVFKVYFHHKYLYMTHTSIHSFIKTFGLLILMCILSISLTHTTHAYFTTAQSAFSLGNGSGLFLIDYKFGMEKREVYMPISAVMSQTVTSSTSVSYIILDSEGNEVAGKASAIVLSSTSITDDLIYKISKTQVGKFTLMVVFTPTEKKVGETYRLLVTYLPFNFDRAQQLQLNPSELKYYTTKPITL